ncbi:hypothetical protein BH20ACT9_BH20ACT9_03260 [soil metagenome]
MRITVSVLRWIALLETASFIGLLGVMLVGSDVGVSIVGAVHGSLFLAYMATLYLTREELGWSLRYVALAILTGPVGAILVLERLRRERVPHEATSAPVERGRRAPVARPPRRTDRP